MSISKEIFKAYDVRGIYPTELDETTAHDIGRAFVAYLDAKRIGVSRDMRLSSPALAAAFIAGAREQGADVVDYGMCATDMMYFGVVRDELDGGAQITASHNPKEYNGVKLVRREAFPLSGDAGIGEIREMVTSKSIPAPSGRAGSVESRSLLDDYVDEGPVVHRPRVDRAVQRRARRRQRHGRARRAAPLRSAPVQDDAAVLRDRRPFPNHEANPLIEENRRDIVERVKADEGGHRHRVGRRRRPVLLHRRHRRVHRG